MPQGLVDGVVAAHVFADDGRVAGTVEEARRVQAARACENRLSFEEPVRQLG